MLRIFILFGLLAWALPCVAAPSFGISPFKVQLVPGSPVRNSQIFQLENGNDEPQAIQVHVETWAIGEDGTEVNTEDTTSFSVYPEQFVLQPHSSQAVRVTWKGEAPKVEKAFRLVAEQLPVDFDPTAVESGIRFLLSYRAALYVTPSKATSDVRVESHTVTADKLALVLVNTGVEHTLLHAPVLSVTKADGHITKMDEKTGLDILADRNIHAGGRLKVEIPWAGGEVKDLKLEFTPIL